MAVQLDANMALMEVDPGTKEIKATPYFEDYLFSLFLSAGGGAMTVEYVDVVQEQVTVSNVVIYTAPISANFESAHIIYANCVNEGGTNTELTLNIVQQGDSIAATNIYFPAKVILAGITDPLTPILGAALKAGDFISIIGEFADNLNLKMTIKEIYTDG